jgi:hypothetical protein
MSDTRGIVNQDPQAATKPDEWVNNFLKVGMVHDDHYRSATF